MLDRSEWTDVALEEESEMFWRELGLDRPE